MVKLPVKLVVGKTTIRLGVKAITLKAKAKAKDGVNANVNMVRCSVKTSKHRRLLQGW